MMSVNGQDLSSIDMHTQVMHFGNSHTAFTSCEPAFIRDRKAVEGGCMVFTVHAF